VIGKLYYGSMRRFYAVTSKLRRKRTTWGGDCVAYTVYHVPYNFERGAPQLALHTTSRSTHGGRLVKDGREGPRLCFKDFDYVVMYRIDLIILNRGGYLII
jgi:hypothetical protein